MAVVEVEFPGNISQVDTAADLRALPSPFIKDDAAYLVTDLGLFTYDAASVSVDDGQTTIKPNDLTPLQAGRWIASGVGLFADRASLTTLDGRVTQNAVFQRTGGTATPLKTKAALTVNIEDFGAVADGVTDSTVAFEQAFSALPNGTEIKFQPGKYILRRSILLTKAFVFTGAGREQCEIHFNADGNYLTAGSGGPKAAIICLHPSVVGINGYNGQAATGYAGRSVFFGIRFSGDRASMPANTVGMFVAAPIYGYESEWVNFTGDGVQINAGNDRATKGNANGTTFTNCNAQNNGQSGWALLGNDVNRCVLTGCNSAQNALHGYYEDVIIGNTFNSCEADSNGGTSYISVRATSRSVFMHCYSETFPHFDVGPRCLLLNMQGNISPDRTYGGGYFGVLPSRDMFAYTPIVAAQSEVIANVMGGPTGPGKAFRISEDGYSWRMMPGQGLTGLSGSANYAQFDVNGQQSTLWCAVDVVGNLKKGVQWAVGGLAFGVQSAIMGSGSAAPTTGSYDRGAIWLNDTPTAGGKIGWVCVTGGSPGTWKAWGAIDA